MLKPFPAAKWNFGTAAHLLNRAGFGGPPAEVERLALDAQVSSDKIRAISNRVENRADYPASGLGNPLRLVARLIGGGLPTRVFSVAQGGCDTHTNQRATQERLLRDLGDSVEWMTSSSRAMAAHAELADPEPPVRAGGGRPTATAPAPACPGRGGR